MIDWPYHVKRWAIFHYLIRQMFEEQKSPLIWHYHKSACDARCKYLVIGNHPEYIIQKYCIVLKLDYLTCDKLIILTPLYKTIIFYYCVSIQLNNMSNGLTTEILTKSFVAKRLKSSVCKNSWKSLENWLSFWQSCTIGQTFELVADIFFQCIIYG